MPRIQRLMLFRSRPGEERIPNCSNPFRCRRFGIDTLRSLDLTWISRKAAPVSEDEHRFFGPSVRTKLRECRFAARELHLVPSVAHRRVIVQRKPCSRIEFHKLPHRSLGHCCRCKDCAHITCLTSGPKHPKTSSHSPSKPKCQNTRR